METNQPKVHQTPYAHQSCLASLREIVPCQYTQWVVEDPETHDYRVVASILPEGEAGYDIAHRTGVIGQVFRTEQSMAVTDTRNHPLYDPFDGSIDWELCFPVFVEGRMTGVINLEGKGALAISAGVWDRVRQTVHETTQCQPPLSPPDVDNPQLIQSRRIMIRSDSGSDCQSDVIELGRALARGGASTLLVGHYPDLLGGRGPTMAEASQQALGLSYCFFGVEKRLDLLATGPMAQESLLEHDADWWSTCKGRYAFVLA